MQFSVPALARKYYIRADSTAVKQAKQGHLLPPPRALASSCATLCGPEPPELCCAGCCTGLALPPPPPPLFIWPIFCIRR